MNLKDDDVVEKVDWDWGDDSKKTPGMISLSQLLSMNDNATPSRWPGSVDDWQPTITHELRNWQPCAIPANKPLIMSTVTEDPVQKLRSKVDQVTLKTCSLVIDGKDELELHD